MKAHEKLLLQNKAWAQEKVADDPEFFKRLVAVQRPEFLWIGCSDSRIPANEVTGTQPGELFVHRNVGSLVISTDINLRSVLEFAVVELQVKNIIVCGHYNCGGILASLDGHTHGTLEGWLRNIKEVYRANQAELDPLEDQAKQERLTQLVVKEQVLNLAKTAVVQRAWRHHHVPHLHGWVYSLEDGVIKPVFDMAPGTRLDDIYEFDDL